MQIISIKFVLTKQLWIILRTAINHLILYARNIWHVCSSHANPYQSVIESVSHQIYQIPSLSPKNDETERRLPMFPMVSRWRQRRRQKPDQTNFTWIYLHIHIFMRWIMQTSESIYPIEFQPVEPDGGLGAMFVIGNGSHFNIPHYSIGVRSGRTFHPWIWNHKSAVEADNILSTWYGKCTNHTCIAVSKFIWRRVASTRQYNRGPFYVFAIEHPRSFQMWARVSPIPVDCLLNCLCWHKIEKLHVLNINQRAGYVCVYTS